MHSNILLIIIGMAAVTFFTRYACLALFNHGGISARLAKWLKYVPTAILSALIAPALLLPTGSLDVSINNHYLLAGAVAALTAYISRNVIATMGLGLAVMFALRWFNGS